MQDTNTNLNCLFEPLEALEAFGELTRALGKPGVCSLYGPDDAQRAHVLAAVARKLGRPLLVIAPNDMAAARMAEDMNVLLGGAARLLPPRDITFLKTAPASHCRDGATCPWTVAAARTKRRRLVYQAVRVSLFSSRAGSKKDAVPL